MRLKQPGSPDQLSDMNTDLGGFLVSTPIDEKLKQAARLTVVENVADKDEARRFLSMLGLD